MIRDEIRQLQGPTSEAALALRETDAYRGPTLVFGKMLYVLRLVYL